jgi:hypothetical protein
MSEQFTKLAKRRGRLPALVTALGLLALLAVQQLLGSLVGYLEIVGITATQPPTSDSGLFDGQAVYAFYPSFDEGLRYALPLALGVFVALWLLAPISHELTLRFVITRAGLAALAGVVLVIAVNIVLGLFVSIHANGQLFGNSIPFVRFDGTEFLQELLSSVTSGLRIFLFDTPAVMLAGVLLWLWLRDHPREYEVSGLVDEL